MRSRDPDTATQPIVGLSESYRVGLVRPHQHTRVQLMYAMRGGMTVLTDRGSWVLPPHRALWIPSNLRHGLKLTTSVELRTLYLTANTRGLPDWTECHVVDVQPLMRELILAIVELGWEYPPRGPGARLASVLLDRLRSVPQQPVHLPEPNDPRARR